MLLPQVLRSRTQLARPLLQRSIRLHTPQTAAGASPLRCFFATVSEGLEGEASGPVVNSPSSSVTPELEGSDNATTTTTTATPATTTAAADTAAAVATTDATQAQTQTQTQTEAQAQTQIENHTQTQAGPQTTQTQPETTENGQRRALVRKVVTGLGPITTTIRRIRCDLHDPDAITRAGFNIRRSSEEASFRIITLERLLEVCRDPTVMPNQHILLTKLEINPEKKGLLKETPCEIRFCDIAEERKWVAAVMQGATVERSPILKILGVADVESDKSRYVIVNHNVLELGIGIRVPGQKDLWKPIESTFPRRIEQNIKFLKMAGADTHLMVEIKGGLFHSYPIVTALGIISNQINTLVCELDRNYVLQLPQVSRGRECKIYRSMLVQFKQATEYAGAILQTPIDELIPITRATTGELETFSRYDALMLYFTESAEAMRKLRKVVARSILVPKGGENMLEDSAETDGYEAFAEMALLSRRIMNNIEAIKAPAKGHGQVVVERFDGAILMRTIGAMELVRRQLINNIQLIQSEIENITKPRSVARYVDTTDQPRAAAAALLAQKQREREEGEGEKEMGKAGLSIKRTATLPAATTIRYVSYDGMYRPSSPSPSITIPAPVTTTTTPGGSREYSTANNITFHGLESRRPKAFPPPARNAFGKIIPMDAPPLREGPIVIKEGTIRHRLQLGEQKRLDSMRGLGYSLVAGSQMGGSGAAGPTTEVVEKEGGGGGVGTWEGTGEFGGLNDESGLTPLKKGDLCELRKGYGPRVAIYLRPSPHGQSTSDFLLENGERAMHAAVRVTFAIPSFISEEKAAEIITTVDSMRANSGLPPQRHKELVLPRSEMADVIERMRAFSGKASALYAIEKANFVRLYERMAHEDEDTELTLFEAAEEIFGEGFGDEQLYTTHLALMEDGVRYLTDKGAHRATSTFRVRAKKDVRMIEFVTEQVRLGTGAASENRKAKRTKQGEVSLLESFARKARIVIDMSRKNAEKDLRTEEGAVRREAVKQVSWDENDIKFIDFIKAGVLQHGSQSVPMDGLVPVILRAMDRYEGELDNITAYQFVTDIGAWNRWEDLALRQKNIGFPGMGTSNQADKDQQRLEAINSEGKGSKGSGSITQRLGLVDALRHIRKDWGNMEVFAIDDITAHEIDDGISLERVDGETSWVHVHIANPTAWLPPRHWLSDVAFRRKQSLYLPDQVLPMLPPALTDIIGLAPNRCVMTMSAKVRHSDGEVLDYTLQPGFVRNVKRFTYQAVTASLGYKTAAEHMAGFEIGNFPKPARADTARPNARQIADLRTLNEIALASRRSRVKNDLINVITPRVDISVHTGLSPFVHPAGPGTGTISTSATPPTPHLYRGHPAIRLSIGSSTAVDDGSRFLVSEMMQLANSVTAKFCGRHGIAVPFRVMEYDYDRADLVHSYKTMILPSRDHLGTVEPEIGIQYMMLIGKTRISAQPSPHRLLGLDDGYIRATSPLRRYSDMITHWQIEAFLLGQEPRTHKQITPFALELERGERLAAFTMKESQRFWAAVAIKRLMELKDPRLPKTLTFLVMEKIPHPGLSTGLVWELGMAGKVAYDSMAQEMGVRAGDTVEVEPMVAMPGERMVWFKYRRVVKRRKLDDVFL